MSLDTSALTGPVDRAEVRAFIERQRRNGTQASRVTAAVVTVIGGGLVLAAAGLLAAVVVALLIDADGRPSPLAFAFLVLLVGVVALVIVALVRLSRARAERRYRFAEFAAANGMTWISDVSDPDLPGMIFAEGHDREATDVVRGQRPRGIEVGNYSYKTGSGKSEQTHKWAYVAIDLDVPLPHMVLDAVGNNGLFGTSSLPMTFGRDQRLSLEGDFDRHFALYCPKGYERDALYLFTPDVMARFIDNAAALDVEIVDDRLFLYSRRELSTLDPQTWEWLFATVAAIDEKLAQWARWRDERLAADPAPEASGVPLLTPPPAGVAREGRRLRRGFSWMTAVLVVLGVGWWLFSVFVDIIGG